MAAFLHTHDKFNRFFFNVLPFFFIVDVFALFQSLNYFKLNQARITVLFAFYVCKSTRVSSSSSLTFSQKNPQVPPSQTENIDD